MVVYGSKNKKKNYQKIWIFAIPEKSIEQIRKTIIERCYKNRTRCFKIARRELQKFEKEYIILEQKKY